MPLNATQRKKEKTKTKKKEKKIKEPQVFKITCLHFLSFTRGTIAVIVKAFWEKNNSSGILYLFCSDIPRIDTSVTAVFPRARIVWWLSRDKWTFEKRHGAKAVLACPWGRGEVSSSQSHFHDWIGYSGVAFFSEVTRMRRTFFEILGVRKSRKLGFKMERLCCLTIGLHQRYAPHSFKR